MMTLAQEIEFDYITTKAVADMYQPSKWRRRYIGAKAWLRRWLEMREAPNVVEERVKFRFQNFSFASEAIVLPTYAAIERAKKTALASNASFYSESGQVAELSDE